jgi:hypothetical protein
MQELPIELNNEAWCELMDRIIQENPDMLGLIIGPFPPNHDLPVLKMLAFNFSFENIRSRYPDPYELLQQYERLHKEGRLIIKPAKPKVKKRYKKADWEAWLVYVVMCRLYGIYLTYEDLAHEMYDPADPSQYPYSAQTVKNKLNEIKAAYI